MRCGYCSISRSIPNRAIPVRRVNRTGFYVAGAAAATPSTWFLYSTDGTHFSEIFRIDSQGDTETGHGYGYHDSAPSQGQNFYRIRQTDFDGTSTYSATVEVWVESVDDIDLVCYPNPARNDFKVRCSSSSIQDVQGRIFDLNGQLLKEFQFYGGPGAQEYPVNIESLPEGVYLVRLFTEETIQTTKLVKAY